MQEHTVNDSGERGGGEREKIAARGSCLRLSREKAWSAMDGSERFEVELEVSRVKIAGLKLGNWNCRLEIRLED